MKYDNKHPLLFASRAYFQQSPTCTRVQIIQLHLLPIITPYHISVIDHACSWKRFCQRSVSSRSVCLLQTVDVTLFNIQHLIEYMFAGRVRLLFLSVHNDIRLVTRTFPQSCILRTHSVRSRTSYAKHYTCYFLSSYISILQILIDGASYAASMSNQVYINLGIHF